MTATRAKPLLTLLAAIMLAAAALTFIKLDLWRPLEPVDAAPRTAIGDFTSDQLIRNYGFRVELTPGPPSDQTQAWKAITGGGFVMEPTEVQAGSDTHTAGPGGRIIVQELQLTGALNGGGALTTASIFPETVDPNVAYAAFEPRQKLFTNQFDTDLSDNVTRIEIAPIVIPALEATDASNFQWKAFHPGAPEPVVVKIDLAVHQDDQVVSDWWDATASGQEARKDIVVNVRQSQADDPAWSTTLFDCAIIDYAPWGIGLSAAGSTGGVITQTVSAKCDRVELSLSRNDINVALQSLIQVGSVVDSNRNITITMLDRDGADVGSPTVYQDAFITRYEFPVFDANEAFVEALETVVFQADTVQLP